MLGVAATMPVVASLPAFRDDDLAADEWALNEKFHGPYHGHELWYDGKPHFITHINTTDGYETITFDREMELWDDEPIVYLGRG